MGYKISIIMPVYNAEEYLQEAIDSILNQTMGMEDIELIMVDDKSSDNSVKIMKENVKKHSNLKGIYFSIGSKMAGKPRNEGLKASTGEYIMFLDADDCLTQDACEYLYNTIIEKQVDFVTANYQNIDENGNILGVSKYFNNKEAKIEKENFIDLCGVMNSAVWNKIFKKDTILKNKIMFLEGVPAEDQFFTYKYFLASNTIYFSNKVIYFYRQRNNGNLSYTNNCNKEFFERSNEAYKEIYKLFKENYQLEYYKKIFPKTFEYITYKFIDSKVLNRFYKLSTLKKMKWFFENPIIYNMNIEKEELKEIMNTVVIKRNYFKAMKIIEKVSVERQMEKMDEEIQGISMPILLNSLTE